jgi:DNA polymerase elongation subunit (family B)
MYGAISSPFFPWNYIEGGEKVTTEGRNILGIMIDKLRESGFVLVNGDTDGTYESLKDFELWNKVIGLKQGEVAPTFK